MVLSLPTEIRVMIWKHVFILPAPTVTIAYRPAEGKTQSVLRILTVCRTILREARHIFYRHNHLELTSAAALFYFLSALEPVRRSQITALTVSGYGVHWTSYQCATQAFSLLSLCPRLQTFRLDLSTEYAWDILEKAPAGVHLYEWREYQTGLDCLFSLRGITVGSIRGINPAQRTASGEYAAADLEEVECCGRADALRETWLHQLPRRSRRLQAGNGSMKR